MIFSLFCCSGWSPGQSTPGLHQKSSIETGRFNALLQSLSLKFNV